MTQTDQQNVPKLRFPGFGGEWESKTLGNLCELQAGKFVRASDIQNDHVEGLFRCFGGNGLRGYVASFNREGTFPLVGRQGALCGNVHLVSGKFYATEHAMVAEPKHEIDITWLYHQLGRMNLNQYSTGLAQPGLSADVVKQVGTSAPTLPEQRKIASFLGAMDTKIAQLARKKALFEDFKKGCMQQLFSQKIRFKDEDGKDFPDWEEKQLGEVLTYEQPTKYLVASSEYSDAYKTPVLTAGKTFILGYTDETQGIFNRLPTIIFDDFTTAFKFVDFPFKAKSSAMKMLSLQNKDDDIRFVYAAMLQVDFQLGEHKRYWISEYQNEFIPVPDPDEQRKIADFLSAIDRKIELVGQQLKHAKTFKKGLLQQMFV